MSLSKLHLYASRAMYPSFFALERRFPARTLPAMRGWSAVGAAFFALHLAIGIFRAGDGFAARAGFDAAERERWLDMALCRDVHRPAFRQPAREPASAV